MAKKKSSDSQELTFKHQGDGKSYRVILPGVEIPGIGTRTALEICADTKAQEYLVKENCIGTVIEEISVEDKDPEEKKKPE